MAETVTLATPVTRTRSTVKLDRVQIELATKTIIVEWTYDNGELGNATYPTPAPQGSSQPTGAAMIQTLNTANLTANSLVKRILNRLQTDGYLAAGAVAGTPD